MRSMLVAGGRGALGSVLVGTARAAGWAVRAPRSDEMDVTSADAVAEWVRRGDVVVNCAAYTAVDDAESDEAAALAINGTGAGTLARACAHAGARLIHVSTDYVFGPASLPSESEVAGESGTPDTGIVAPRPLRVDDPPAPLTAYGRTKLAGEGAVLGSGADAQVVRTAWLYRGPRAAGASDFVATMARLEGERDEVRVVTDQIGSPTSIWDLAAGLVELAGADVGRGILHAVNSGVASWYDLARAVFVELGADPERVRPCTSEEFVRPAPRPAYSVLDGASWAAAGLAPLGPWRRALTDAIHPV